MNTDVASKGTPSVYPLSHATVVRVITHVITPTPENFRVRKTLVKISPKSKFFGVTPEASGVGEVVGHKPSEPGWVYVRFPSNYRNRYRIGIPDLDGGACDLELAQDLSPVTYAVAIVGQQLMEFPVTGFSVESGDTLKLGRDHRVVAVEKGIASGSLAFVAQIIDEQIVLVDFQGHRRTVFVGKYGGKLELNGRVVLDASGSVVVGNFGLEDDSFTLDQEALVTWDDICGQEEAKNRFQDVLERPSRRKAHYAFFNKKSLSGVLLEGPPGCSKTMFGKAIFASMVATCKARGVNPSQGFVLISGPEILDKYVGVPEATIRHLFARARKFFRTTGIRPVIFIDEAEAILAKRDSGISSDVLRTIVPAFLAEMQGVRESGAFVVLATNKPEILDYAAIREGRIDATIKIDRPDRKASGEIFLKNMARVPVSHSTTLEELTTVFVEELFSHKRVIYELTRAKGDGVETLHFTLAEIVSGAMIPAIVEEAKRLALERELEKPEPTEGVRKEDVVAGVESIFRQKFATDHAEALRDFTHDFAEDIRGVKKLVQAKS